jgi:hypothetical protein
MKAKRSSPELAIRLRRPKEELWYVPQSAIGLQPLDILLPSSLPMPAPARSAAMLLASLEEGCMDALTDTALWCESPPLDCGYWLSMLC